MKITDENLYQLCKTFGARALLWRQKFIGLLPEVNRRKLYEKKGFGSIFEFAAKLAGVREEQVRTVLSLGEKFEDKPLMKALLENGHVSPNKLARIASVVTSENEQFWANQSQLLPQRALETMVRDAKHECEIPQQRGDENGLFEPQSGRESVRVQMAGIVFDDDVQAELNELFAKGIDVNELLREMLQRRRKEIVEAKEKIATTIVPSTSRYIPVAVKKIIAQEHGTKCSINGCAKEAEELHHAQRFGLSQNHDPRFLAPLCRDHHVIAHSIDVKFHEARMAAAP